MYLGDICFAHYTLDKMEDRSDKILDADTRHPWVFHGIEGYAAPAPMPEWAEPHLVREIAGAPEPFADIELDELAPLILTDHPIATPMAHLHPVLTDRPVVVFVAAACFADARRGVRIRISLRVLLA